MGEGSNYPERNWSISTSTAVIEGYEEGCVARLREGYVARLREAAREHETEAEALDKREEEIFQSAYEKHKVHFHELGNDPMSEEVYRKIFDSEKEKAKEKLHPRINPDNGNGRGFGGGAAGAA